MALAAALLVPLTIPAAITAGLIVVGSFFTNTDDVQACESPGSMPTEAVGQPLPTGHVIDGRPATVEQLTIARTIVHNGRANQFADRDIDLVLMLGIQESRLRNLPYGDRDSKGVFQFRPSQGWGTPEQVMDVNYATNKVYSVVNGIGNRAERPLLDVALDVLRPSRRAYQKSFHTWQPVAERLRAEFLTEITDPEKGCEVNLGIPGKVTVTPGANAPGRPLQPDVLNFLERMSSLLGRPLVVTTGTSHSFLVKNSNRVSDHVGGNAADLGMRANGGTKSGPVGDQIAAACLQLAGETPENAMRLASQGGLWTRSLPGLKIQCIWKTDRGGDHYSHVHVAAKPTFGSIQPNPVNQPTTTTTQTGDNIEKASLGHHVLSVEP